MRIPRLTKKEYLVLSSMFHRSKVAHGLPKIMIDAMELARELDISEKQVGAILGSLKKKRFTKIVGSIRGLKRKIKVWKATEAGFEAIAKFDGFLN